MDQPKIPRDILPITAPLHTYINLFHQSSPLPPKAFNGTFDAILIGPSWFKYFLKFLLQCSGLAGWQGKEFGSEGVGMNFCLRNGQIKKTAPMYIKGVVISVIDDQPSLALGYPEKTVLRFITDEIRLYDHDTILGITYLEIPVLRHIRLPFALRYRH